MPQNGVGLRLDISITFKCKILTLFAWFVFFHQYVDPKLWLVYISLNCPLSVEMRWHGGSRVRASRPVYQSLNNHISKWQKVPKWTYIIITCDVYSVCSELHVATQRRDTLTCLYPFTPKTFIQWTCWCPVDWSLKSSHFNMHCFSNKFIKFNSHVCNIVFHYSIKIW